MVRMIKRADITKFKSISIRIIAILGALIVAGLFIKLLGHNPLEVYKSMVLGAFGTQHRIRQTLIIAIPLVITSVGIMIAFKMNFWNIGAEGQILMGAFLASFVALNFPALPKPLLLTLMFIAGIIGGGLWALIPAMLKVKFDTNETITTLMMNYIAIKWITYLQYGPWKDPKAMGFPKIADFSQQGQLPKLFGIHIGWIIAIILVVIVYMFLHHSKKGFEITVVGQSTDTARYAGMDVKKVMLSALFISGGICGITGMIQASGVARSLSVEVSAGYGFTAIITAWLSGLRSIVIVPVSILFAMLLQGGSYIQTAFQIPKAAAEILQGLILFFILGSEFFIRYKLIWNKKSSKEAK